MKNYNVLLFYQFVDIDDLNNHQSFHYNLAHKYHLMGRIYISKEGLNGTVSGKKEETEKYMKALNNHPYYKTMQFKIAAHNQHAFNKLHVRIKDEIVNFNVPSIDVPSMRAPYINPEDFYKALNDENTVVIDARNDYEFQVGHFRGALNPNIKNFRELPQWIEKNQSRFQGKSIVTYCTGGIRCEKLTSYMKQIGINDVYQLKGGIHTYGTNPSTQGRLWDGALYVFDKRMTTPLNRVNPIVIGKDHFTSVPCERYINCGNPECNKKIVCTKESEQIYYGSCTEACRVHPRNRYMLKLDKFLDEGLFKGLTN